MVDDGNRAESGQPQAATRSGAEAIVEALHACNVEIVFGYSGRGTGALIHHSECVHKSSDRATRRRVIRWAKAIPLKVLGRGVRDVNR